MFRKWAARRVAQEVRRNQRKASPQQRNWNDVKRLMLFVQGGDWEELQPILKELAKAKIEVFLYLFLPNIVTPEMEQAGVASLRIVSSNDLKLGGKLPSRDLRHEVASVQVDALCNLFREKSSVATFLSARANTPMKVGLKRFFDSPYNLTIQHEEDLSLQKLWEIALFYWRKIDIKENIL